MGTERSPRGTHLRGRKMLQVAAWLLVGVPVVLACNIWRFLPVVEGGLAALDEESWQEIVWTAMGIRARNEGTPTTEPGQQDLAIAPVQGALDSLAGELPSLPSQGTWTAECQDVGGVEWLKENCDVDWASTIRVTVDFGSRTFDLEDASSCSATSPGLFVERHHQISDTLLELDGGQVLEDGRLWGRSSILATRSTWIEGGDVASDPPESYPVMVVGFVSAGEPFMGLSKCTEEGIQGGADAMLAAGWRQDLNPCTGTAEWPIVCQVQTGG